MDRMLARRVVAVYEAVRERVTGFEYGIPESVLPYSKGQIKRALQHLLLDVQDDTLRSHYVASYMLLSRFRPNEQAHRGLVVQAAKEREDAKWLAELPALRDILEDIKNEQERLGQELNLFLAGN